MYTVKEPFVDSPKKKTATRKRDYPCTFSSEFAILRFFFFLPELTGQSFIARAFFLLRREKVNFCDKHKKRGQGFLYEEGKK